MKNSLPRISTRAVVDAYRSGESISDISTHCGCAPETIRRRLLRIGEPLRRQGRPSLSLPMDEIAERYKNGESSRALARAYGCHARTICGRLKKHGTKLRGPEGWKST